MSVRIFSSANVLSYNFNLISMHLSSSHMYNSYNKYSKKNSKKNCSKATP